MSGERQNKRKSMKKNFFKAFFAVAAIATVGLGSYKAYGSYVASNMSDDDLLLTEDVLALSDPNPTPKYADYEGSLDNCTINKTVCSSCGASLSSKGCISLLIGYTHSKSTTKPVNGHIYNCKGGERLTFAECTAIQKAIPTHEQNQSNCSKYGCATNK